MTYTIDRNLEDFKAWAGGKATLDVLIEKGVCDVVEDFIDVGVSKKYLLDEWHKAMRAETTPNCHVKCNVCGAMRYGGGVCFNEENGVLAGRAGADVPYIYPVEECNPVPGIHTPASS